MNNQIHWNNGNFHNSTEPADRKLSKIETLRLASSYIAHLGTQLIAGKIGHLCNSEMQALFLNIICFICFLIKTKT
jgi:hypothetical protein